MIEEVIHRAVGAQVAAELGERVPHVGDSAVPVVGHAVDHHRSPAGTVPFVANFLVVRAPSISPAARLIARSMLSFGTLCDLALSTASRKRGFDADRCPRCGRRWQPHE